MNGLIRFSLKQTVFLNILFVLLIVVGVYAWNVVPVERYPPVNMGQVAIWTIFPGASPADIEAMVTSKLEEALEDLENVEYIRATSVRDRSRVVVKFIDDTDYDRGYDDLRLKILSHMGELPRGIEPPTFEVIDTDDVYPVMAVNLAGDRSNRALTLMAERLKDQIRDVPGVKEVELTGEMEREFHITLDKAALRRFGLSFDQVATVLEAANVALPAGDLDTASGEYVLVTDQQFRDRDDVAQTVIRRDGDGSLLRLSDVMVQAEMNYREPSILTSVNGKDCVTLKVIKNQMGNALVIREAVASLVADSQPLLEREGVETVFTQDSTVEINDGMRTLGLNLMVGIILVCLIIWLFMGFRNACLTTIGIPFAFLVTMIIMEVFGYSLNEITLFSFVLISGIVVDDAIVVIENIYRHQQMGKSLHEAVIDGTGEVFLPVVAATLTTVCAFLPMLIMTGYIGEFFSQIPKAVTFALIASVLECLLILPIHYKEWGPKQVAPVDEREMWLMRVLRKPVDRMIRLCLRFPWVVIAMVTIALAAAVVITGLSFSGKAPLIRIQLFPDDYNLYYVEIEGPVGTSLEQTSAALKTISEDLLAEGKGVTASVAAYAGFIIHQDYTVSFNPYIGHLVVTLPAKEDRVFADAPKNDPLQHLEWVRDKLTAWDARGFSVRVRPNADGPPSGADINVRAVGSDADNVQALADRMKAYLMDESIWKGELFDFQDDRGDNLPTVVYKVDPERAAQYQVTPGQVVRLTAAALNGRYIGQFRASDELVPLKLRLQDLANPEDALTIPLIEHESGPVLIGDVSSLDIRHEAGFLNRFQGERAINISANIRLGSSLSSAAVVHRVRQFYLTIQDDYPGATLNFTGQFDDTNRSFKSLGYAFAIGVMLIYLILATQFKSYTQPLIVLSAVVFAFIGVIFGMFFSRALFTINNMIAMVGVVGVVVNDSLVLIEFINKLHASGLSHREAVIKGTQVRLRPILVTTLTTMLAFLPMALGIPEYSLVWGSMASTFVTGLATATFLTLFVVPVQWELLARFRDRFGKRSD